jgi:dipeptidyl aminopeptidase/acylaminoacyl peptidase
MKKFAFLPMLLPAFFVSCTNHPAPVAAVKEYTVQELYDNKNISADAFNADDSKIMVDANISGIYNLYELNIADSSMKPLTHSAKESFYGVDYLAGSDKFIYNADQGGNENSHLYLMSPGDTSARDLTPWAKSANSFYKWSDDKKYFFISSNRRDVKYFDLLKMDTSKWVPTMFYQNDSAYEPGILSSTNRYITLAKSITTDKNELYLFDESEKKLKKLSNGNEARWTAVAFEKNDSILYYITNDSSEFSYLVKYNIHSGKTEKLYSTNWDVTWMNLSKNEKYRTVFINEDGKSKVLLFDHALNKPLEFPEIPGADIQSVLISESEKNMALTVGSSRSPYNIYVYNFETKVLKQLTQNLNPAVNQTDLVNAEVIRYKSFDGLEIPAILYKPILAGPQNKVPAVLSIHGGPGGQSTVGFSNNIQYLVNHGYAVLAVNNRGSSGYGKTFYKLDNKDHGNGDLKDCIWAKKWLQQQDYIDTGKIAIMGGSYGGCMVLSALAFYPNEYKAGVDYFGVANWLRTLRSIPPYWETFRKALYDEMGDPNTADSVMLKNTSPLFNYQKINKPLIVFQGMNDVRVLPIESQEIVAGVRKNGVPVEYVTYADEGHGFQKKENQMDAISKTLIFLDKYVKGNPSPASK